jgi:DNA repair exonuclease SbcCD ATPase subunit
MVSPGRLFNTPPGVRMSPGKRRVLYGPGPSIKSIHSALTRVSAALAESRNLHTRMMNAGVQKRAAHQRVSDLVGKLARLQQRMRLRPSAALQEQIDHVQRQINDELPNMTNKERRSAVLIKEYEKSMKRYHQLARRVAHLNRTRNLNNRPLSPREKHIIRTTARIVRNMSAAQRTVPHLPIPRNMGHLVIRSAVRR